MSEKTKIITTIFGSLLLGSLFYVLGGGFRTVFLVGVAGTIILIFFYSIWAGRELPVKWFLFSVIILSLSWLGFIFDYGNLDSLFLSDDHPKFFTFTHQNAQLLLNHGSPFGFNHYFQGGIPTLYLRSCFLEYIPFLLIFGDQVGYQIMLIFFLLLIPVSLYFLIREITTNENVARTVSFLSAFQFGTWGCLWCGNSPILMAMPLMFFSIFFFIKYLHDKNYYLFPVLFFSGLLAYTHLLAFVIAWLGFGVFLGHRLITKKEIASDLEKFIYLGCLSILVCSPLLYVLISHSSFFTSVCKITSDPPTLFAHIKIILFNLKSMIHFKNPLFLSILFLAVTFKFYSRKRLVFHALLFSIGVFLFISLDYIPTLEVLIFRIDDQFKSYLAIFNFSLFMLLGVNRKVKAGWVILMMFFIYQLFLRQMGLLPAVPAVKNVDATIDALVEPEDYVLFEHCAHMPPGKKGAAFERRSIHCCHWETHLQRLLGVKFFSHMGDDSHTYNRLKHMYLNTGFYKGKLLGEKAHDEDFLKLLKHWGVTKACVWTRAAKRFFDQTQEFQRLGRSEKYQCYAAVYDVPPPVRLSKGGTGKLMQETPFSFEVELKNISQKQTATINKNYFDFWSACDENGNPVELSDCDQMICFEAEQNGRIYFQYQKNILLNIIPVLTLVSVFIGDIFRQRRLIRHSVDKRK